MTITRRTVFAMPFIMVTTACRHPAPIVTYPDEESEHSDDSEEDMRGGGGGGDEPAVRDARLVDAPIDARPGPAAARFRVDALPPLESADDYHLECAAGIYQCSPIPPRAGVPTAFAAEITAIAADGTGSRVRFAADPRITMRDWTFAIGREACTITAIGAREIECTTSADATALDFDHVQVTPTPESVGAYWRAECHHPTVYCNPPRPEWEGVHLLKMTAVSGGMMLTADRPKWVQLARTGSKCRIPAMAAARCEIARLDPRTIDVVVSDVTYGQVKDLHEIEVRP